MSLHIDDRERKIFPALLNDFERQLLQQLATESGLSRSAVVRELLLKEFASRRLTEHRQGMGERLTK